MLVELLRHAGVDLTRRWVGALLLVPPDEREDIVQAVERQVVSLYAADPTDDEPVSARATDAPDTPHARPKARRIEPAERSGSPPFSPARSPSVFESSPPAPARRRSGA